MVSKRIFDGKIMQVRIEDILLPNGNVIDKEIVERINGVSILPIEKEKIFLIQQYVPGKEKYVWGVPQGGIKGRFEKEGYVTTESSVEAAQRELFEEIGYKAGKLEFLFHAEGDATIRHGIDYFLATELFEPPEERHIDENELIDLFLVDFDFAYEMAMNAEFQNPAVSLMILMARNKKII